MRVLLILAVAFLNACGGGGVQQPQTVGVSQKSVIFIGDSITQRWDLSASFPGKTYINKGIGSETSAMVLARFQSDVIALHPDEVVILVGINDIGQGIQLSTTQANISQMIAMSQSANIKVIVGTVLPVGQSMTVFNPQVVALDNWIRQQNVTIADYYSAIQQNGMLPASLSIGDDVHLNSAGYQVLTSTIAPSL